MTKASKIEELETLLGPALKQYGGTTGQINNGHTLVQVEVHHRQEHNGDQSQYGVTCSHGNLYRFCPALHSEEEKKQHETDITMERHCHRHLGKGVDKKARKKLVTATLLCLFFMLAEIIGGYLANSLAIATDAAHLLTDVAGFSISLAALYLATLPATRKMNFGWYRAEVVGALVSVLLIWVVTAVLVFMAVQRIRSGDFEIKGYIMIFNAVLGVCVNIIMGVVLNRKDESEEQHSGENLNVRAAFIHVLGDLMQSVGVLTAALIIYFRPDWKIVDPICTFLFSILVLITTLTIMKDTMLALMEGVPPGMDYNEVEDTLKQLNEVEAVHDMKIWALSMERPALSAHLAIKPCYDPRAVLSTATSKLKQKYMFQLVTLQIEDHLDEMRMCEQCQPLKKPMAT